MNTQKPLSLKYEKEIAPTQQESAISSGLMLSTLISGAVRDAAVVMATVAEPRAIRIRAAIINGIKTAGIGQDVTISPRAVPIPLTFTTFPRLPPAPVISMMIPVSLIASSIIPRTFLLSSFFTRP